MAVPERLKGREGRRPTLNPDTSFSVQWACHTSALGDKSQHTDTLLQMCLPNIFFSTCPPCSQKTISKTKEDVCGHFFDYGNLGNFTVPPPGSPRPRTQPPEVLRGVGWGNIHLSLTCVTISSFSPAWAEARVPRSEPRRETGQTGPAASLAIDPGPELFWVGQFRVCPPSVLRYWEPG
jgi:hypothetical protein